MFHSRIFRSIIILIVALVFASTAYALAASNTLADAGKAGDGSNTVSGYSVSGVTYNLDALDPSLIASVEFDLDATASTEGPANHWTCTFGTFSALKADSFRVISAQ